MECDAFLGVAVVLPISPEGLTCLRPRRGYRSRAVHSTAASFGALKLAQQDAYEADGSRRSAVKSALENLIHPTLDDRHGLGCRLSPTVELIAAVLVTQPDNGLLHGKNPRQLCLSLSAGQGHLLLDVRRRFQILKEAIAGASPRSDLILPRKEIRLLARWLGKRYTRDAFPDSFNERLRPAQRQLEKISKSAAGAHITTIAVVEQIGRYEMFAYPRSALGPVEHLYARCEPEQNPTRSTAQEGILARPTLAPDQ